MLKFMCTRSCHHIANRPRLSVTLNSSRPAVRRKLTPCSRAEHASASHVPRLPLQIWPALCVTKELQGQLQRPLQLQRQLQRQRQRQPLPFQLQLQRQLLQQELLQRQIPLQQQQQLRKVVTQVRNLRQALTLQQVRNMMQALTLQTLLTTQASPMILTSNGFMMSLQWRNHN